MKTVTLELIASEVMLADMCQLHGWNESNSECPLGNKFKCPFKCPCEKVTAEMWNGLTEEDN